MSRDSELYLRDIADASAQIRIAREGALDFRQKSSLGEPKSHLQRSREAFPVRAAMAFDHQPVHAQQHRPVGFAGIHAAAEAVERRARRQRSEL